MRDSWFAGSVHGEIYPDYVEPTAGIVLSIRLECGEFLEQESKKLGVGAGEHGGCCRVGRSREG